MKDTLKAMKTAYEATPVSKETEASRKKMQSAMDNVTEAIQGAENGSMTVADVEKKLNNGFYKMNDALEELEKNGIDVSVLKLVVNSITKLISALGETKGTSDNPTNDISQTALNKAKDVA